MTVAPEAFADRIRGHDLEALLGAVLDGARRTLDDAVSAGVPIRALYLDVLQPALLVIADPASGALRFASAGHLPPLRLRADGAVELDGGRSTPLLAYEERAPGRASLGAGDRLVLYTDGLVERRTESIEVSLERLVAAADGRAAARDDVAIIALERA